MKKILFVLIAGLACLLLASCEKAETPAPEPEERTLRIGDPESAVMEILGAPQGTSEAKGSTIYMYNRIGTIVAKNGLVSSLPPGFVMPAKTQVASPAADRVKRSVHTHRYENINRSRDQRKATGLDWVLQEREKEIKANLQARAEAEREAERKAAEIRKRNDEKRRHVERLEEIETANDRWWHYHRRRR